MLARIPRQLTTYLSSTRIVVQSHRCVTNAHKRITNGSQHPAEGLYILEFQNVQHMIQLKHMVATLTQLFAQKSAVHKSSGRKFPCFCAQRFAARLGYVSKLVRGKDMCQKSCHLLIHSSPMCWRIYGSEVANLWYFSQPPSTLQHTEPNRPHRVAVSRKMEWIEGSLCCSS